MTSWSAWVSCVTLPEATSIETRLARPRSDDTSTIAVVADPDGQRPGCAARGVLVAGETGADVAVEVFCEVSRNGAGGGVDDVEVGLSEGSRGLAEGSAKREPAAVGAER